MDQWWSKRLHLQASTPSPCLHPLSTSAPCLCTKTPTRGNLPLRAPTTCRASRANSHGGSGQLWGSHPCALFQPLAELLVDLHPRVGGGP